MKPVVLDASTVLSWFFQDEAAEIPLRFVGIVMAVPPIWFMELASGFLKAERRGRITRTQTTQTIEILMSMLDRVEVEQNGPVFASLLPLAREQGLSVYDAAYLEMAIRRGYPLATKDGKLTDAAKRCGVELIEEE